MSSLRSASPIAPPYQLAATRHGTMLVNQNDFYMGVSFLRYGECCEQEIHVLTTLLLLPGAVIEVGANMGAHTVPLALELARQGRRMTVFEPQPVIFQQLCANLALNGLMNVTALNCACGSEAATLYFNNPDYRSIGNFGNIDMSAQPSSAADTTAVPCCRLDSVIGEEHVGIIKIDVEGFELRVLQGAAKIIARSRPVLYVENDRLDRSRELIQWLLDQGYRIFWHAPAPFNPDNFAGERENIYGNVHFCNMICLHGSSGASLQGYIEVTDAATPHPFAHDALRS